MRNSAEQVKTYRLDGEIKALTPLSHIGETHGTDSYLAEQVVVGPDGEPQEVFVYSGNASRGPDEGLRRPIPAGQAWGLQVPLETFHLLFSGGSLGSKTFVDVEQGQNVSEAAPALLNPGRWHRQSDNIRQAAGRAALPRHGRMPSGSCPRNTRKGNCPAGDSGLWR